MDGRCIHFYGAKVKPAWCIFLTGAAPHTCMCKSQKCEMAAGRTWEPGFQDEYSEPWEVLVRVGCTGVQTNAWRQGSYCVVIKMVFHRISVICRTLGVECLNKHGACSWGTEGWETEASSRTGMCGALWKEAICWRLELHLGSTWSACQNRLLDSRSSDLGGLVWTWEPVFDPGDAETVSVSRSYFEQRHKYVTYDPVSWKINFSLRYVNSTIGPGLKCQLHTAQQLRA